MPWRVGPSGVRRPGCGRRFLEHGGQAREHELQLIAGNSFVPRAAIVHLQQLIDPALLLPDRGGVLFLLAAQRAVLLHHPLMFALQPLETSRQFLEALVE